MSLRLGIGAFASRACRFALALSCAGAMLAGPARASSLGDWQWQQPVSPSIAAFSVSPAVAGSASTFDASGSTAPVGSITSYHWSFGDGASANAATPRIAHTYASPGSYTATLTETDTVDVSFLGVHFTRQSQTAPVSHTLLVPPPPAAQQPQPAVAVAPVVHVSSGPVTVGPRGNVWVWLSCPRSARAGCHGTVTIQLAGGWRTRSHKRRARAVAARCARGCRALGSATYEARAGQRVHVRVRMASFVRSLLARQQDLRVRLTVTSVGSGHVVLSSTALTLRARHHGRHQPHR
jgi:hypothetical protein